MTPAPHRRARAEAPPERRDREMIEDFRALADEVGLPETCRLARCRRARRCRGALKLPTIAGRELVPGCFADALDAIMEPVAEFYAFRAEMGRMAARLAALAAGARPGRDAP